MKLDSAVLARYVGTYEFADFSVTFTLDVNQLMGQATNQPKGPVFPESQTKFLLKESETEMEFFNDDKGQVSYLVLHLSGHDRKEVRK